MRRRLALGGRIDRYVGKQFLASYTMAFLMVVGLFLVVDMTGRLGDFLTPDEHGRTPPTSEVVRYYLLGLPFIYLQVAPFVTLLAGLFTVTKLLRHSEVTAVLNAGISARRMLVPVFVGAALVGAGMIVLREWAVETLGHERFLVQDRLEESRAQPILKRVFLRDAHATQVRIEEFHLGSEDGEGAFAVGFTAMVGSAGHKVSIEAERAFYVPAAPGEVGTWRLVGGVREDVDDAEHPPTPVEVLEGMGFTPDDVLIAERARERPLELSIREARLLGRRDPDNVQWKTLLHYHLSFPLANLVLLLVALPFVMRFGHGRGRGAEGVAAGFLLCVFYYGADFVSRTMGMEGALSPLMATWLPLVLFGSLGTVLFGSLRS